MMNKDEALKMAINLLETLKNGFGFSTMYEPRMRFWNTPHVFVFANFPPELYRLSADRWDIHDIEQELF